MGFFTIVKTIFSVTGFLHFTKVNVVCRDSNGGRMKAKFTLVKRPEKACLSRVYLNFVY